MILLIAGVSHLDFPRQKQNIFEGFSDCIPNLVPSLNKSII